MILLIFLFNRKQIHTLIEIYRLIFQNTAKTTRIKRIYHQKAINYHCHLVPNECLLLIINELNIVDLVSIAQTNKHFLMKIFKWTNWFPWQSTISRIWWSKSNWYNPIKNHIKKLCPKFKSIAINWQCVIHKSDNQKYRKTLNTFIKSIKRYCSESMELCNVTFEFI